MMTAVNGRDWVRRTNGSQKNIETCNGVATADADTHTCELCVALNRTVYLNNNKPQYRHEQCKCRYEPYRMKGITEDFPKSKIFGYLFKEPNKSAMMRSMGYEAKDAGYIYAWISRTLEREFLSGNYTLGNLDIHGQHFSIHTKINGKGNRMNETFSCHIGCVVWPDGKLKVATPLIKD